jgi:hypothetical protein
VCAARFEDAREIWDGIVIDLRFGAKVKGDDSRVTTRRFLVARQTRFERAKQAIAGHFRCAEIMINEPRLIKSSSAFIVGEFIRARSALLHC